MRQHIDALVRLLWKKAPAQLEPLDAKLDAASRPILVASTETAVSTSKSAQPARRVSAESVGLPRCIPIGPTDEDPSNPRTGFSDAEIDELADDVRRRGILHPADAQGSHLLHVGPKRLRAALRAGLSELPVVVRDAPANVYNQVAENQKRHALSPRDLAHFIEGRVGKGRLSMQIGVSRDDTFRCRRCGAAAPTLPPR